MLQDVIERLLGMQVITVKPDSCIIDFFNEVACSGICLISLILVCGMLSQCEIVDLSVGRSLTASHVATLVWEACLHPVLDRM